MEAFTPGFWLVDVLCTALIDSVFDDFCSFGIKFDSFKVLRPNIFKHNNHRSEMDSSCQITSDFCEPLLDLHEKNAAAVDGEAWENEFDVTCSSSSVNIKEEEDEEEEAAGDDCMDAFALWVLLPTLLISQFAMAFWMHDEDTANMSWTIVVLSVLFFAVTSWLFRNTCDELKVRTTVLYLMPEILMNVVLYLILLHHDQSGLLVLLVGMLGLAIFVVLCTAWFLFTSRKVQRKNEHGLVCQVV